MEEIKWPTKHNVIGVGVSATTYQEATELIITAAKQGIAAKVNHLPVHGLVLCSEDSKHNAVMSDFELVVPDGQPVRWALNAIHKTKLPTNIRGSELMWRLCERAAKDGVGVYCYGSTPEVIEALEKNLKHSFPGIIIAGCESPPFRPLTDEEDKEMCNRLNSSGAGLVFIGLGCPRQEFFVHEHKDSINAVQLCVGAAFDFHAGMKNMAPVWMQKCGLEWVFRLMDEPGRLWKRYAVTNTVFIWKFFLQYTGLKK
jgi:N-acetylglucosaminyldiphosphoundecaprenol N-acetyl-beta-D-mannosaminyltransferase